MARYSVPPKNRIFAKNMGRNISKHKSNNLSSKYSQKLIDHTKQSATYAIKNAWKRAI